MKLKDFDFRVWNKETNAFVDNLAFLSKFKTDIGSCIVAQDNGEWYSWDDTEKLEIELYTGFKDKKGRKLYENDIVKWGVIGDLSDEFGVIGCEISDSVGIHFYVNVFDDKGNFKERFALAKINTHFVIVGNVRKEIK